MYEDEYEQVYNNYRLSSSKSESYSDSHRSMLFDDSQAFIVVHTKIKMNYSFSWLFGEFSEIKES